MQKDERDHYIEVLKGVIKELEEDSIENIAYTQQFPYNPVYKPGSPDPVDFSRKDCRLIRTFTIIRNPEKK